MTIADAYLNGFKLNHWYLASNNMYYKLIMLRETSTFAWWTPYDKDFEGNKSEPEDFDVSSEKQELV